MTVRADAGVLPREVPPPWTFEGHAQPHRWFQRMLREQPVFFDSAAGVWHVLGFEDVHRFLKRPQDWSTAKRLEHVPAEQRVVRLLTSDPPQHVQLRGHFSHAYRPRRVASMEERTREVCRALLEEGVARGRLDAVTEFAHPLTLSLICQIIGAPDEDQRELAGVGTKRLGCLKRADDPDGRLQFYMGEEDPDEQRRIDRYFGQLVERGRREPRDDLVSDLARMDPAEMENRLDLSALLVEQLAAGQNTTVHLIGSMLALLLEHPDQLAKLRARPELVPSAVEETLRFASPLQARPRVSAQPLEMRGQSIPEGAPGLAWLQAANLDPEFFEKPERFDIERSPNHHVAFGHGEHFCLGAALARMEARVALEEWLRLTRDYGRAGDAPLEWTPDFVLRGLEHLELDVVPA